MRNIRNIHQTSGCQLVLLQDAQQPKSPVQISGTLVASLLCVKVSSFTIDLYIIYLNYQHVALFITAAAITTHQLRLEAQTIASTRPHSTPSTTVHSLLFIWINRTICDWQLLCLLSALHTCSNPKCPAKKCISYIAVHTLAFKTKRVPTAHCNKVLLSLDNFRRNHCRPYWQRWGAVWVLSIFLPEISQPQSLWGENITFCSPKLTFGSFTMSGFQTLQSFVFTLAAV